MPIRRARACRPKTRVKPPTQRAVRLMPQPRPGELDTERPHPPIATAADALLGDGLVAAVRSRRQSHDGPQLSAIAKRPPRVELRRQRQRAVQRDAAQLHQPRGLRGHHIGRGPYARAALPLEFEPARFHVAHRRPVAQESRDQRHRERAAIPQPHGRQPLRESGRQRHGHALRHEQALDPVPQALSVFAHGLPFALQLPIVLGLDRRHTHLAPPAAIPRRGIHQLHDERRRVHAIGLGAPLPPIDRNARRVDDDIGETVGDQGAMQPKPIPAGFVGRLAAPPAPRANALVTEVRSRGPSGRPARRHPPVRRRRLCQAGGVASGPRRDAARALR